MKPQFRLHPPAKGTWINCYIWPDRDSLIAATEDRIEANDHAACFIGGPYRLTLDCELITRKVGELHFYEGRIGAGIVAHEIQHFIIHWQGFSGWDVEGENWEDVASLAGNLTAEFWYQWHEHYE